MATTTVRIEASTHASLTLLSEEAGASLIETIRDAAEALRRQRFAERVTRQLAKLQLDAPAWQEYLGDAGASEVTDGVG